MVGPVPWGRCTDNDAGRRIGFCVPISVGGVVGVKIAFRVLFYVGCRVFLVFARVVELFPVLALRPTVLYPNWPRISAPPQVGRQRGGLWYLVVGRNARRLGLFVQVTRTVSVDGVGLLSVSFDNR